MSGEYGTAKKRKIETGSGTDFKTLLKIAGIVFLVGIFLVIGSHIYNSSANTVNPSEETLNPDQAKSEAGTGTNVSKSGAKIYTLETETRTVTTSLGGLVEIPGNVYRTTIPVKEFGFGQEEEYYEAYASIKSEGILACRTGGPTRVFAVVEKKNLEDLFLEVNGVSLNNFRMVDQPTSDQKNKYTLYVDVASNPIKKFSVYVYLTSKMPFKREDTLYADQTPTEVAESSEEVLLEHSIKNWDKAKFILLDMRFGRGQYCW